MIENIMVIQENIFIFITIINFWFNKAAHTITIIKKE